MKKNFISFLLISFTVFGITLAKNITVKTQDSIYRPGQIFTVSSAALPANCNNNIGALFIQISDGSLFTCKSVAGQNIFIPLAATPVPAKTITGIQDNTFTDVITVTVPNAASGATIEIVLTASLGAGGALGQYESSIGEYALVTVTRVPGRTTAKGLSIGTVGTLAQSVGASGITQNIQLSANTGANTAQQTFTIQYSIARTAGASNNHIASVISRIISPTLTNITIQ